jgi:hypothetical protein
MAVGIKRVFMFHLFEQQSEKEPSLWNVEMDMRRSKVLAQVSLSSA